MKRKIKKKSFSVFPDTKCQFFRPENFTKNLLSAVSTGYYLRKKTNVVPDTKNISQNINLGNS